MKNLILIVVTLFLASIALVIYGEAYNFGDMIAFSRKIRCPCKPFTYKHYAVYVGSEELKNKLENQDIFHLTGAASNLLRGEKLSDCIFSELAKEGDHKLDNYLDELWKNDGKEIDVPGIKKRIEEKYKNCGSWVPLTNNCEHVATYVRYGLKVSFQCGTSASKIVFNTKVSKKMIKKIKETLNAPTCESSCSLSRGDKSG
ncbi:hypothetical protein GOODEAATRI_032983 [Goodea atripinnis]|uniref:LRAT domain-containing protein n=1 Tax=Goodea atripinnis TaxID=208336 RepID=A0ABV0Q3S5_9TELE